MSLIVESKPAMGILLTNAEVQFYRLSFICGQTVNLRATHTARADGRLVFMQRLHSECFFEIPEQAVAQLEKLSAVGREEMTPIRFSADDALQKYFLKLPGDQLCNIIATDMRRTRQRVRFYAEQYPFITIPSAKDCEFGPCPWDTNGLASTVGWR